ncbi:SurA N-terminal domain-containing protein [Cyclobacteriaceae bacterium]|nr:SurA N-terminal domain-containing protein [Cyclobacteriaceae bacterium]
MAVLGSIRQKTGLMLIVVLGATSAFILGDLISNNRSVDAGIVGEIDGNEVSSQQYDQLVDRNKEFTQGDVSQAQNRAWQQLIFEYGWLPELEKAGIAVTREGEDGDEMSEEFDYFQGKTLHKDFLSQNQEKKPVFEFINEFSQTLSSVFAQGTDGQYAQYYTNLEKNRDLFYQSRMRDKYTSLFTNSVYVTTAEARRNAQNTGADAAKASFDYVYVPFTKVADSTIEVSDEELEAYLEENKGQFDVKDNRSISYVALSYEPSNDDKINKFTEATRIKNEFVTAEDDQGFVNQNADNASNFSLQLYASIPQQVKNDSANLKEGNVYGPFEVGAAYETYKVSQIRLGEGISKANVSFIFVDTSRIADDKKEGALDSARTMLATAQKDSASMASLQWSPGQEIESTDTLNFPKEAIEKIFADNSEGLIEELIEIPAGIFIIKKNAKVEGADTKYAIAKVDIEIIPSEETINGVWQKASDLVSNFTTKEALEDSAKMMGLKLESVPTLAKTARAIGRYRDDEVADIVSWAYQAQVGTISGDVFNLSAQSVYVITTLDSETEEGNPTVEGLRKELTAAVIKKKKAEQLKALLESKSGSTKEIADAVNADNAGYATANTSADVTLGSRSIPNFFFGIDNIMLGTVFGLENGATSKVVVGDNGVFVVKVTNKTEAVNKKNYTAQKEQMVAQVKYSQPGKVSNAFEELLDIEDLRFKR